MVVILSDNLYENVIEDDWKVKFVLTCPL